MQRFAILHATDLWPERPALGNIPSAWPGQDLTVLVVSRETKNHKMQRPFFVIGMGKGYAVQAGDKIQLFNSGTDREMGLGYVWEKHEINDKTAFPYGASSIHREAWVMK